MATQLSLSSLLQSVGLASWKARIEQVASDVGLETENWSDVGFTRKMLAVFAVLYTSAGDLVRIIAAAGFLDHAEGAWLELLAWNVFRVEKIKATYASAVDAIKLTNTGGGLYVIEVGDLIVSHATTKKTYRNSTAGTLSPGVGQILRLDLVADEAGSGSNASIGTITGLVTNQFAVTVTNEVALAGLDEESDPLLRQRCRDSNATLSIGGIRKAYEYYAKSAVDDDGVSVGVTRVKVMEAPGDGTLTVYVAGESGAMSGPAVAFVQATFDLNVTPYGFNATATSAANLSVSKPCTIWIPSSLGLTTLEAQEAVDDALAEYVGAVDIGGVLIAPTAGRIYWRKLLGVVEDAIPGMLKAQLTSETDVTVADGEVPIWAGVSADVTVNQVT